MFFATPVIRTVARTEFPSTREAITCWRFSTDNRFILTIMLERLGKVKGVRQAFACLVTQDGVQLSVQADLLTVEG